MRSAAAAADTRHPVDDALCVRRPFQAGILRGIEAEPCHHAAIEIEPDVHAGDVPVASNREHGAHHQHERQCHLRGNERLPQPETRRGGLGALTHFVHRGGARRPDGRDERADEGRRADHSEREREQPPVERHRVLYPGEARGQRHVVEHERHGKPHEGAGGDD
jgi:hypothetical protein